MYIKQHIQKAHKENSIASKRSVYLEHGGKETLEVNVLCLSLCTNTSWIKIFLFSSWGKIHTY